MTQPLRALCLIAIAASAAVQPLSAQEDVTRWTGQLSNGDFLEVRGISGDIRAVLASGNAAEVVAEKHGRRSDFHRVHIVVEELRGGVIVCALYGEDRAGDSCDDDHHHDRGDHGRRSINVSVDFEVRLPAGVDFEGAIVSGDILVDDVRSDVRATSVSGDVEVSTSGIAEASTVSGSIDVALGSEDWRDLRYNTVSGDITVHLPAGIGTEVEFESLSGELDSDFDMSLDRSDRRWVGSRVRATIGDGSRSLELKTVSGDARLRRLR